MGPFLYLSHVLPFLYESDMQKNEYVFFLSIFSSEVSEVLS